MDISYSKLVRLYHKRNAVNGHEFVDLGLPSGRLWAKYNIGSESITDSGIYFPYGEIRGKRKDSPNKSTLSSQFKQSILDFIDSNTTDLCVVPKDKDAATYLWKEPWKMPSISDCHELIKNCETECVVENGVNIIQLTSKINGKSISFPMSGWIEDGAMQSVESCTFFWTSTYKISQSDKVIPYNAYLEYGDTGGRTVSKSQLLYAQVIRPVI